MKKKVIAGSLVAAIVTTNTIGVDGMENVIQNEITKQGSNIELIDETKSQVSNDIEGLELKEESLEEVKDVTEEIDNNIVEEEVKEETVEEKVDATFKDTNEKVEEITQDESNDLVEVGSEEELLNALKNGSSIKLTDDIVLTNPLDMRVSDVTIDGDGFSISADPNLEFNTKTLITVRLSNNTIKNLVIKEYRNAPAAILAYNTTNLILQDITCEGIKGDSKAGIDISGGSGTILENITTSNHYQAAIRLKNGATVTLKGENNHVGDTYQILLDETYPNTLHNNGQYIQTGTNGKDVYYNIQNVIDVDSEEELEQAVLNAGAIINIIDDFTITKEIVIEAKAAKIRINGRKFTIDCGETGKLTIKASDTKINNLTLTNYLNTGLMVYGAKNVILSNITMEGNSLDLEDGSRRSNSERSKTGIDIANKSTVTLDGITSLNHIQKGILVRGESTLDIQSTPLHKNDTVHIQTMKGASENANTFTYLKDAYTPKNPTTDSQGKETTEYFTRQVIEINTAQDLIDNSRNCGTILSLGDDITFDESMLDRLNQLDPHPFPEYADKEGFEKDLVLNILQEIALDGNGYTINLNGVCGLVLNKDNTRVEDVIVANSASNGIVVHDSKNTVLKRVTVRNSENSGIVANGSIVDVIDCVTINNGECGIMSTRSRTLDKKGNPDLYRDSIVTIKGLFEQQEPSRGLVIRNLEMIYSPNYIQNNQIIFDDKSMEGSYESISTSEVKAELSDYYKLVFEEYLRDNGISLDTGFGTTDVDTVKKLTTLDVTTQTECVDEDGNPIQLDPTGVNDNTDKFIQLLKYATLNSNELYFPAGTYKITGDIDLTKLGTKAFSNVKITGDIDGLSVIDGSTASQMLVIRNNDYHARMNHVNVNNMVFNNVGLDFNGVYKKNISVNDCVFMNGKYTVADGKATMIPYITANNSTYLIENNIFLRGEEYAGRGISTYATMNTVIRNNFFGNLEGKEDALKMIPNLSIKLNLLTKTKMVSGKQGNFFTCVNNERKDINVTIQNNYFNINEGREIDGVPSHLSISGLSGTKDGQRRDHIIYSKGYNHLNIIGNYFKGMENGAAGGVKIRNGENAYIGSNHFKNVPLLTYIYGDLTLEECKLHNTTIYNNLFHETENIGGEGTGILYYQSFREGDNLSFSDGGTWNGAYGDVKNFVMYQNQFASGKGSVITISNRAQNAFKDGEFIASENKYYGEETLVNYNKGNLVLEESTSDDALSRVNGGYNMFNTINIPLTPIKVENSNLSNAIDDANEFIENIKDQIGDEDEQYSQVLVDQLLELLEKAQEVLKGSNVTQMEINTKVEEINKLVDKIKRDINTDSSGGVVEEQPPVLDGTENDNIMVKPEPETPGDDFDSDMNVKPEPEIPGDDFDSDMNVKPEPETPDNDFDSDVNVKPEDNEVQDGTHNDDMMIKPEDTPNEEDKPSDDDNVEEDDNNNDNNTNEDTDNGNNSVNNGGNSGNGSISSPQTGDVGILGAASAMAMSLIGLVTMRRRNKKK